jgi:hypothetical protein
LLHDPACAVTPKNKPDGFVEVALPIATLAPTYGDGYGRFGSVKTGRRRAHVERVKTGRCAWSVDGVHQRSVTDCRSPNKRHGWRRLPRFGEEGVNCERPVEVASAEHVTNGDDLHLERSIRGARAALKGTTDGEQCNLNSKEPHDVTVTALNVKERPSI